MTDEPDIGERPEVEVVAWMHPTSNMVSTDPTAYTGLAAGPPRELAFKDSLYDELDWLEKGNLEWRSLFQRARDEYKELQARNGAMLLALLYAIKEADGWHDDSQGGKIETPEMEAARHIAGVGK